MNPLMMLMQGMRNPQAMIQNMLGNPQIMNSPLGNAVNAASKGDQKTLEEIARNMCKEKGINPDDAFNQIKQMMNGNMPKQ